MHNNAQTSCTTLLSPRGPSLAPSDNSPCVAPAETKTACVAARNLALRSGREMGGHWPAPTEKKNPLPFQNFGAVTGLWFAPDEQIKGNGVKRVETVGVYPSCPRRGCGEPPPPKVGAHSRCFSKQINQNYPHPVDKEKSLHTQAFLIPQWLSAAPARKTRSVFRSCRIFADVR